MNRAILVLGLAFLVSVHTGYAQRKGLNFNKEAYEKVPLADEEKLGYTDEALPAFISHKTYAPYAGNQGDYGTCVGWSSAYGALTMEYAMKMGISDREQITFTAFCPYYIYNQFKDDYDFFCQSGGFFEDALDIMYSKGAKRYYLPEYSCYSDYSSFSSNAANAFKINNYFRLFDWAESEFDKSLGLESDRVENIKKALANGHPVLIGMYVPGSFDYISGDVWDPTQEERDGFNTHAGHAMTIVGYDDSKYGGAVEILNSWGRQWGNDGFTWVRYEDLDIFGHTAFYMDLGYKYYPDNGCQFGDCANEYSRYKFDNGEIYEGGLRENFFSGDGIYLWTNGEAFAGGWKEGFKHGKGTQMYSDGSVLTGFWKDNLYYGSTEPEWDEEDLVVVDTDTEEDDTDTDTSSLWGDDTWDDFDWDEFWLDIFSDSTETAEEEVPTTGCVSGDCENGFGKYVYSDDDVYEGYFKSGYRHGFGKYEYVEGDVYEGIWSWGDRQGLGYYQWPSGNEYMGMWANNQQNGKGAKFFTDGSTEAGEWKDGAFQSTSFGYAGTDEPTGQDFKEGTYFNRVDNGRVNFSKYRQIPMKQGRAGGLPASGLGTPMPDPYKKMAQQVVSDIVTGLGKADITNPRVNIIDSDRDVAYTSRTTGIHVSTRFIDLCRSFGEDSLSALSVVLAHELGHYYKDHFFCRDFGYAYGETEWGQQIEESFGDIFETGVYETEADEFGLFFSFVSGYDPFKVAEQVIEKVYETFSLPEEMRGYPPKAARMEQVRKAAAHVRKLIPLFEVGNLMAVLGAADGTGLSDPLLENSSLCYEHILDQKITTAEIYNNLGVNYVNRALGLIEKEDFPFGLPLELDFGSRLYTITETGSGKGWGDDDGDDLGFGDDGELASHYLDQALSYFELAYKIESDYLQAYNNAAAAYLLQGDYDEAWVKARKARKMAKEQDLDIPLRNSLDLLAIIAHYNDEPGDAAAYWEAAMELNSQLAAHNRTVASGAPGNDLAVSRSDEASGKPVYTRPGYRDLERIDDKSLYDIGADFLYNGAPMDTWPLKDQKAMVGKTDYNGGEFLIYASMDRNRIRDSYYFYFIDGKSERRSSLDVGNASSGSDVKAAYGTPVSITSSATHDYWVYLHKNIIFKMDRSNHVDGFILYDVNI